jgi:hypothetical protein
MSFATTISELVGARGVDHFESLGFIRFDWLNRRTTAAD